MASAVRLRTDFTGTRVWRPSGETEPLASHGWSSPGYVASARGCAAIEWATTSSRVTIPPGPFGVTESRSTPSSFASLRTGGFARARTDPGVAGEGADDGAPGLAALVGRSEEHTSELQSRENLVCRL